MLLILRGILLTAQHFSSSKISPLCDHLVGDAGAAVQNQRNVVGGLVDAVQSLEVQTLPVCGVDAVDVADAGSQEVDAQTENDFMDPIIVKDVSIIGKVIGVFRFFR